MIQAWSMAAYIDGRLLADQLDIKLPEAKTVFNPTPRIDAKLKSLVRKPWPPLGVYPQPRH